MSRSMGDFVAFVETGSDNYGNALGDTRLKVVVQI